MRSLRHTKTEASTQPGLSHLDSHAAGAIACEPTSPTTTRVIWSNEGELGNHPRTRWMGVAMDRMVGNDFATGVANLKALATR